MLVILHGWTQSGLVLPQVDWQAWSPVAPDNVWDLVQIGDARMLWTISRSIKIQVDYITSDVSTNLLHGRLTHLCSSQTLSTEEKLFIIWQYITFLFLPLKNGFVIFYCGPYQLPYGPLILKIQLNPRPFFSNLQNQINHLCIYLGTL